MFPSLGAIGMIFEFPLKLHISSDNIHTWVYVVDSLTMQTELDCVVDVLVELEGVGLVQCIGAKLLLVCQSPNQDLSAKDTTASHRYLNS